MAIIFTAAFVHSLVAVFHGAECRVVVEKVSMDCSMGTASYAALLTYASRPYRSGVGRTRSFRGEFLSVLVRGPETTYHGHRINYSMLAAVYVACILIVFIRCVTKMIAMYRVILFCLFSAVSGYALCSPVLYTVEGTISGLYGSGPSVDGLSLSFGDEVTIQFLIDTERSGYIEHSDGSIEYVVDEFTDDWSYESFYAELVSISYTVTETYYNWGLTNYFAENIDDPAFSSLIGSVMVGPDKLYLDTSSYIENWQLDDAFHSTHWWHDPVTGEFITLLAQLNLTEITAIPVPAAAWLFGSGLLWLIGISKRKKSS